jgi:hypothetical protein
LAITFETPIHNAGQLASLTTYFDPRFPSNAIPAIAETVTGQASLVYAVDDDHAEGREDAGDPIDEGEVEDGAVEGGFGVAGGIDKDEEGDGELWSVLLADVEDEGGSEGSVAYKTTG